jgi:transposase-like protein
MTRDERRRRRFTEDFKKTQVQLIEAGTLTVLDVSKLYEVRRNNVYNWVIKYGSKPPLKPIIVSDGSEINKLKELEKENKRLLEIIGKQQVELFYNKTVVELAKSKLGEDFEKK